MTQYIKVIELIENMVKENVLFNTPAIWITLSKIIDLQSEEACQSLKEAGY